MANAAPAVKLADAALAQTKKATRAAFGATLAELADAGVPVVAVDADLTGSTTTAAFAAASPVLCPFLSPARYHTG